MGEGLSQPTHLILILLIIFIVFGAGKLPEVGTALGRGIREFRRSANELAEHGPTETERSVGTTEPKTSNSSNTKEIS